MRGYNRKGIKLSQETKDKMSKSHAGYKFSSEAKEKMRQAKLGHKWSMEDRQKLSKTLLGHKLSEETKRKIGNANKGEKSAMWKGGISSERKKIYNSFEYKMWARMVKERDNFECQICGERTMVGLGHRVNLRSNHIKKFCDYPELRLVLNNGITICKRCDLSLVMYHEPDWESYFNFNLMTRGIIENDLELNK